MDKIYTQAVLNVYGNLVNTVSIDTIDWLDKHTTTDVEAAAIAIEVIRITRANAYPSLTEQADMAYWDRQNGTTTLDDAINAVKAAHPIP
jgi:hypothetical protein